MILSLPSGAGGGASKGQSMATVRMTDTMKVMGMSRYLRISRGYCSQKLIARNVYKKKGLLEKLKVVVYCRFVGFDQGRSGR